MEIIIKSSWQAFKDVSYMYVAGVIMSFLTALHLGNMSLVFTHAGWGFLAVSLYTLAAFDFSSAYHRDNNKDRANRSFGIVISIFCLVASSILLSMSVSSGLKSKPIDFELYTQTLWFFILFGTMLRYLSRNISLQRDKGRYI